MPRSTSCNLLNLIITHKNRKKTGNTETCVTIKRMNPVQEKILLLARTMNLEAARRVDLVELVGCKYPSQITHHMQQLIKSGDLVRVAGKLVPAMKSVAGYLTIPVMGEADCGEATRYAEGRVIDNLVVSPSIITSKRLDRLYALIARGDSMNSASVRGKFIEDGDYVIIEKLDTYQPQDNDIVVSNIGGLANIKRFKREPGRIVLLSDSQRQLDFSPIFIDEQDDYSIEGKVVDVVKGVAS